MKHLVLLCLLALAACCPTASPDQLTRGLNHAYGGEPANRFFFQYGKPSGEFTYLDGSRTYRWTSVLPAASPSLALYRSPTGTYELADNYHGLVITHYCELRILTDPQDTIQRFDIAVDSIGKWSPSHCEEIFQL